MYKKFIFLILIICASLALCACNKPTAVILFNKYPITKENMLENSNEFMAGKKIYYLFMTEDPLETKLIRVMVIKREEKANFALSKIVYSNDFRLNKDQVFYYNDYLVFYDAGYYCMKIYSKDDLERPIVIGDFRVIR